VPTLYIGHTEETVVACAAHANSSVK
jgi:hypothetical protein